jgi:membrane fusion protein, copper/silver efflux system
MKKIFGYKYIRFSFILILGIFLGWIFFHSTPTQTEEEHNRSTEVNKAQIWTCSMHPQIRMDKPGKCPICAMDLIPVNQGGTSEMDPAAIHLTKEAAQLANVLTSVVSKQNPVKEVRLYGKVQADERLIQNQVAHVSGRIEKLMVNFTGEPVQKGQKLALIYSPELITAQQELLETAKTKQAQPEIYEASKEKLRQWKLTETQILSIESSGNIQTNIEVESTSSGIVTARRVNNGDYVSQGSVLYEVSDLSRVWVLFDAYESDLHFLKKGDRIDFTIQALPGADFSGSVMFIDPVIDPVNRVAKVRIEISNPGGKLKPEMFATGNVKSDLKEYNGKLVIPRSAVLWTGKRSIVYVKQAGTEEPVFKIREIELGPQLGDSYLVRDGLNDGEEIVTQGAFSVDAAAQLEGKPSMMNPSEEKESTMPGMDMGSNEMENHLAGQQGKTNVSPGMLKYQQLKVAGLCDMCKERIETAAKSVNGVKSAEWSAEKQMLNLSFDTSITSVDVIAKVIAGVGHDNEKYKAPDEVYNKLPECCLYRK